MLGNMKFVGELLCKKMLSSKIIFQCVDELLDVKNDEAIETLAVRAFHLSWLDAPRTACSDRVASVDSKKHLAISLLRHVKNLEFVKI